MNETESTSLPETKASPWWQPIPLTKEAKEKEAISWESKPFPSATSLAKHEYEAPLWKGALYWLEYKLCSILTSDPLLLLTAFSTSSCAAAMPITFEVLEKKVGLRESSVALGH
jgi:hypothetical protein